MSSPDATRLFLFTLFWTAVWVAPVPRLGRWAEVVAGLIPFSAFGLRVFAGFFVGVPVEDPVRVAVSPLLEWVDGRSGFPPYAWVLDATVAVGLVWLAPAFNIPRYARIATVWIMPAVAMLAWLSLRVSGLPLERLLARRLPAALLGLAAGSAIGAIIRWTPSPIPERVRKRAAIMAMLTVPAFVAAGTGALWCMAWLPPEHASQVESIVALVSGAGAAMVGWICGGFVRPRSRFLFAMAIGVAAGAVIALNGRQNIVAVECATLRFRDGVIEQRDAEDKRMPSLGTVLAGRLMMPLPMAALISGMMTLIATRQPRGARRTDPTRSFRVRLLHLHSLRRADLGAGDRVHVGGAPIPRGGPGRHGWCWPRSFCARRC